MSEILLYYKRPDPTTWVYMSSFLTIGLYFVFHRFWSIRNLDVVLLILLAPGLLMVYEGYRRQLQETEAVARQRRQDPIETGSAQQAGSMTSLVAVLPVFAVAQVDQSETDFQNQDGGRRGDAALGNQVGQRPDPVDTTLRQEAQSDLGAGGENLGGQGETVENRGATSDGQPAEFGQDASESAGEGEFQPASRFTSAEIQRWGFIYLFVIQSFILLRLLLDPLMSRRPLLDPNLSVGGLTFIGISLFIFMMANVVGSSPRLQVTQGPALGPGYPMMNMLPAIPTRPVTDQVGGALPPETHELTPHQAQLARIAKVLAIFAHLAIVTGIVLIANRHFGNLSAGVGCATLYLMLPYTAQMTGRVDHAIPAALLLWAVLCYRKPLIAGIFLGLAGGLLYYPLFLLPLWFSFYWQRGARRFGIGVVAMLVLLMIALWFDDSASLWEHLRRMFGLLNPNREAHELRGIWGLGWNPIWRLPVIVAFVILSVFFAIWPAQKNLGSLLSGSAALMVAAQFWHGYGGGLYIAWFLPLLLLTVFRPNLQDRVATKVVQLGSNRSPQRSELEPV